MKLENFFQHMQLTRVQFTTFYKEVFFFLQLNNKKVNSKKIRKKGTEQDFLKNKPTCPRSIC